GIGIIGTGFARKVQIPAFNQCKNAEIVSVASGRRENAEEVAKEFNIAHFTDNWRETVEREDVDLVCITTPPNLHREMTLFALEHNKHILCEKPMAMNTGEASEMTEKAKEKNVLALIDHELRFQNGRQKAFEILRGGDIGKIIHAKYNFRNHSRGDVNLPWNWWSDKSQGGGALGAISSHVVDSFRWFLGAEISQVFCQLQTHVKERKDAESGEMRSVTSDDESNMILRFASGDLTEDATGIVSVSMVERPKYENTIEFFGTKGALRVGYKGEIFLAKENENDWHEVEVEFDKEIKSIADTGFSRGFTSFAPKIIKAIQAGKTEIEHAATFADGLKVQEALDAAHESNESGCAVKI
ncbi:MAG TPA: Gfo/Idh/MocA family oxidoreductase, partial [Pyrinomonadaceae bacterium]|nr:Gfo/Idh/MocA family oxidoreductase [Pyrinomonadaceae bacterium]